MEKNIKHRLSRQGIAAIGAVVVLFIGTLVVYKVDATEYAVVTQFGNPISTELEPGLKIKLPDPVQSVQKLDKRVQVYQADSLELLTLDKKSVAIDYYGTWKITDPVTYIKTVKDKIGAEARLSDVFSSSLGIQMGKYNLEQLVNTDSEKLKLEMMLEDTVSYAKEKATEYGIEVIDAKIRALNFPESNKQSVYDRMKAEREQMAKKYRSEGSEEAAKIRADAEKEKHISRRSRSKALVMQKQSVFMGKHSRKIPISMNLYGRWKPMKRLLIRIQH